MLEPQPRTFRAQTEGLSLSAARDLSTLNQVTGTHSTLAAGASDLFRFTLSIPHFGLAASLTSQTGDADLEIIRDANNNRRVDPGEVLGTSTQSGSNLDIIRLNQRLSGGGNYYLRVSAKPQLATTYQLRLEGDSAGDDLTSGRSLGELKPARPISVSETVGSFEQYLLQDRFDYFRFRVASTQLVTLNLASGSSTHQAAILDSEGNGLVSTQIGERNNFGNRPATYLLKEGLYYVRMDKLLPAGPDRYSFNLTAQQLPLPAEWTASVNNSNFLTGTLYNSEARDIALDSSGHSFLATYSNSPGRAFISEYNAQGNLMRKFEFAQLGAVTDVDIATDGAGNLYAAAVDRAGSVLAKYDAQGQLLWRNLLTQQPDLQIRDIAVTARGEIYATGDRPGTAWVAQYNSNGEQVWLRDVVSWADSSGGQDFGRYVAVDSQGNVVVSGDTLVSGGTGNSSGNFVVKYSSGQQQTWSSQISTSGPGSTSPGSTVPSSAAGLSLDTQGNAYAATSGGQVVKLSASTGAFSWQRNLGSGVTLSDIDFRNGKLSIVGNAPAPGAAPTSPPSASPPPLPTTAFVTQFDEQGNEAPRRAYFPGSQERGKVIAVDVKGHLYVAGDSTRVLRGVDRTPGDDAFLIRFNRYSVS
jgi:PQQ-like domain